MSEPSNLSPAPDAKPLLVALHFLGGSADQWAPVFDLLTGRFQCVAVDLPGFGSAVRTPGYDVASMAEHVAAEIRRLAPASWLLVGHSMGAKVACAVTRMAEDGVAGLGGLTHLVLVAGSPPAPEPMEDSKRQAMRRWFDGSDAERRREADGYIRDNIASTLPEPLHEGLVGAVLKAKREAWLSWLDVGSQEDWAPRIGMLQTPALILAGEKDAALGRDAQRSTMVPHFASVRLHVLPDAGHLLPSERPETVAACIRTFVGAPKQAEPEIPPDYQALIHSHRVSVRTRDVLVARAEAVSGHAGLLSADEFTVLQSLVDRIIPQAGERRIDIAARMLAMMSQGPGDGWRFAKLPPDKESLRSGLRNLDAIARAVDAAGFAFLPTEQQDALLAAIVDQQLTSPFLREASSSTRQQLQLWFEDMRSIATQLYVSHPATAARIGFSGIANRGDGSGPQGFTNIGLGQNEPWEPTSKAEYAQ